MVGVDYPLDRNRIGMVITKAWIAGGDIVRDMVPLFKKFNFEYTDIEIDGYGSVHLYLARIKYRCVLGEQHLELLWKNSRHS